MMDVRPHPNNFAIYAAAFAGLMLAPPLIPFAGNSWPRHSRRPGTRAHRAWRRRRAAGRA